MRLTPAVLLLSLVAATAAQSQVRNAELGYTLTLPQGFTEFPEAHSQKDVVDAWTEATPTSPNGAVVILVSTAAVAFPDPIQEWINIVLGVALIVSPWALGYSDHQVATMSAFASGLLITGFATWALEHMTHLLSRMLGRQKTS